MTTSTHYHVWKAALAKDGQARAMFRAARPFRTRSLANKWARAAGRQGVHQAHAERGIVVMLCADLACRHRGQCPHRWQRMPDGGQACTICEARR